MGRRSGPELDDQEITNFLIKDSQGFSKIESRTPHPANLFSDTYGIVRVGGRLKHAPIPYEERHPIFLDSKTRLTKLIFENFHNEVKHQGRVITLSAIRAAGFYCDNMRKIVSSIIQSCVICKKLRSIPKVPFMSDLPTIRLEEVPPFTNVGIDLFGPFLVYEGAQTRRCNPNKKRWGVLFICLVSRAVHVETVPGLDGSSFKNALRRFISVRGNCKRIRSDNGTNLTSTKAEMESNGGLIALKEEASARGIEWSTTPPGASHFGGSWERAIGSVRKILNASLLQLGHRSLSSDELDTLFKECAGIINSTPLYDSPCEADEPLPLTPAHLLFMKDSSDAPLDNFSEEDLNAYGTRRWRRVQHLANEFWRRWRTCYLQSLQTREKWLIHRKNIKVGDNVLLKDKNLKRNDWRMAVVESVRESADGVVRDCITRTSSGLLRRAVKDIVILCSSC